MMEKRVTPVKPGDTVLLKITGMNHSGEGVGRINGFTLFIPGSLPGETAQVEVTEVKKKFGRGILRSLLLAASGRREVDCNCYEACGGCQLLHLVYEEQLLWKRQLVAETLARLGGIETPVNPVLGMTDPYHYRNKVQLHVQEKERKTAVADEEAQVVIPGYSLGYYQEKSRHLVPVTGCSLWPQSFHSVVTKLVSLLAQAKLGEKIKHIGLREGEENQVMVILVTGYREDSSLLQDMVTQLIDQSPASRVNIASVYHNINPQKGSQVFGREFVHLAGEKQLAIKLGHLEFFLSPAAFFQVNTKQAKVLSDQVVKYAGLTGREVVLDAYCGTGTIGLYLAGKAKQVVGIETEVAAIGDARQNARHNGIENAVFYAGKVEELLPKLVQDGFIAQVVVLDPPRAGCDRQVLAVLSRMQPERIIYVSCDPATLARDLKYLKGDGYQVVEVQPVDMFPQTNHVECVVLMSRV